jgi:hypothetical protein
MLSGGGAGRFRGPSVIQGPGIGADFGSGERCGVVVAGAEIGAFLADLFVDFDQGVEAVDVPDFGLGQETQERVDDVQEPSFGAVAGADGYVGELERRLLPTFSATRFEPEVVSVSFSATRRRLPLAYS